MLNLSPAIIGLLQSLPPWPKPFPPHERERFMVAFAAVLDMEYPISEPQREPPPVSNEFVLPGCERFAESPVNGTGQ